MKAAFSLALLLAAAACAAAAPAPIAPFVVPYALESTEPIVINETNFYHLKGFPGLTAKYNADDSCAAAAGKTVEEILAMIGEGAQNFRRQTLLMPDFAADLQQLTHNNMTGSVDGETRRNRLQFGPDSHLPPSGPPRAGTPAFDADPNCVLYRTSKGAGAYYNHALYFGEPLSLLLVGRVG